MSLIPSITPVHPKPALPKTIGSLNFALGFFLFLISLGLLHRVGPSLTKNDPFLLESGDAQRLYDQIRLGHLAAMERNEKLVPDAKKKDWLRAERAKVEGNHSTSIDKQVDIKSFNRVLLLFNWYFWTYFMTGAFLNLLMLCSGLGLTQLRMWARRMAIWVALLKGARAILFSAILAFLIVPKALVVLDQIAPTELGTVLISVLNAAVLLYSQGPPPLVYTAENSPIQVCAFAIFLSFLLLAVTLLYSAITLFVLTRAGATEACMLAELELAETEEREGSWS